MRPSDLSGGMKKRVGLARTLALAARGHPLRRAHHGARPDQHGAHQPPDRGIQRALKLTSVVVTHDMGTAFSVSDRLAMIGKGRILLVGTKEEFRATTNPTVRDFIEGHAPETEDVASLLSSS
jgi:phospholipid/cholesterol/gamma-HCH transport system ATP-binding protein